MPQAPDLSGCALDGRYELHAVIGEGAFGRVYSGRDRRLERPVAVKMIKPWWAEDPEWVRSFEREAQLLARVSDPGIVQIFDVGHAEEGLYYVSELIDGESLAARLRRGRIAPGDAAALAEQLCRALGHAHAQGVVHRDVKPANILISADGRVKVGDFGVARLAEGSGDGSNATIVGTPRYMAPEQARGRRTTPATDVYSVGIVLYEMLAGRPPFTQRAAVELALCHLKDPPPPLPAVTPPRLEQIVARALAKHAGARFRTGGEMADALARARTAVPARPRGELFRERPSRRRQPARALKAGPARVPALAAAPGSSRFPGSGSNPPPHRRPEPDRLPPAGPGPDATRRAPRLSRRRNLNPAARRRSAAGLSLAFLLLGAMIIAGFLIAGATGYVRVPRLTALTRAMATDRAQRLSLHPAFASRYDRTAPKGTVVGQIPIPGRRVEDGSTLRVILSAGPPPVTLPPLAGLSALDAQATLHGLGLEAKLTEIAAPGVPAGTVTSQSPAPKVQLIPGASVALNVAETPHWQPVTAISGSGNGQSVRFAVRGTQWRLVYTMSYQGTCSLILFCSGPNAEVTSLRRGDTTGFGLADGGRQTHQLASGPGNYELKLIPGSDTAHWTMWVEDYY